MRHAFWSWTMKNPFAGLPNVRDRLFKEKTSLWEHEAFVDKPVSVTGLLEAVSLLFFGHTHGPETEP